MEQRLSIAISKVDTTKKDLEQTSIRRELIQKFQYHAKPYGIYKDAASQQHILLQWILQQVPLIKFELDSAEVTETPA